jgi:hypothetical protein
MEPTRIGMEAFSCVTVQLSTPLSASAYRITADFDDVTAVPVDSFSGYWMEEARALILAAGDSTQTGCPLGVARKGSTTASSTGRL